jgi:predicted ATPase
MNSSEQYVREVKLRRERVASFDQYPFSLPVVRNLHTLLLHPAVTFIVGENGTGKSTLLEALAIAWGFNPEGGTKNFQFQTRGSHSPLSEYLTLVKNFHRPKDGFFLRAESFSISPLISSGWMRNRPERLSSSTHTAVVRFTSNHTGSRSSR